MSKNRSRVYTYHFYKLFSPINSIRSHKIGPVHLDQSLETSKVGYNALSLAKKFKIFFSNSGRASTIFLSRYIYFNNFLLCVSETWLSVITSSLTSSSLGWRLPSRKIFRLNMKYIIYTIYGAIKPYLFARTIRTDFIFLSNR